MWWRRGLDAAEARWRHTFADHNRHLAGDFRFTANILRIVKAMLKSLECLLTAFYSRMFLLLLTGEVGKQM